MSFVAATISAAAGRIPADKPSLSYAGNGQFTINSYNSLYIYSLSNSIAYFSSNKVILPDVNSYTYVYAKTAKGFLSTGTYIERKAYVKDVYHPGTSYCDGTETFDNCGPPLHADGSYYCYCGTSGSCAEGGDSCCGWVCHGTTRTTAPSYTANQTPLSQGYTDSGTEWYKIL
jgi:hypothetical protein